MGKAREASCDNEPMDRCRPTILVILDGVGINPDPQNNALAQARTPRLDALFSEHAFTQLQASGAAVGLPDGQMGNSEVGHMIMGCGSIVLQDLVRINQDIRDGSFYENPVLLESVRETVSRGSRLHLLGLVSDGGVHSHVRHLLALIELARREGAAPHVHMFTDGRDVPPQSALGYLPELEAALEGVGSIDTVCGRYYAMDRDRRWQRTRRVFDAIVHGRGASAPDVATAIRQAYSEDCGDEFIEPTVCASAAPLALEDLIVFFNFRNDRPRQLAESLSRPVFKEFDRGNYTPVKLVTMTEFGLDHGVPVAFEEAQPEVTLAEIVSRQGIPQLHCAETEKYPHVTFFFNGGREPPWPGEQRVMLPSPNVETYDQCPEMSAEAVADAVVDAIRSQQYGFILVNFANADMVGHTAQADAIIRAIEALDAQVGRIVDAAKEHGMALMLTADHGNCDEMIDADGRPHTQHTTHPVPCVVMDQSGRHLRDGGGLGNVAPTVLDLMGLERPSEMSMDSLLRS